MQTNEAVPTVDELNAMDKETAYKWERDGRISTPHGVVKVYTRSIAHNVSTGEELLDSAVGALVDDRTKGFCYRRGAGWMTIEEGKAYDAAEQEEREARRKKAMAERRKAMKAKAAKASA